MKIIKYSALNLQGENIKGSCEYDSLHEVKKKFREKGFYIYKTSNKVQLRKILFTRPGFMEISLLCNKMSIMMESGIGISKIFMMLERQSNNAALRAALYDIKLQVMQGKSLYSSMKKFSSIFPGYMLEMIGVGEEAGNLEKVLKELSKYYEHQYKIQSGIKSALVYPVLTFVISICIIVFLMNNIIPQFINILQSNKAEIPVITKLVINAFDFLKGYFMFITSGMILFIFTVYKFSTSQKGKYILDTVKINMPYFGKLYNEILMLKIASSMRILNISGVNILKSLYITSKTLESSIMNKKMLASIEAVKSGESIGSAFGKSGIGNEMFIYMIKTGEEAGKLDYIFNKLEEIFCEDVYRSLKSMVRITEPVIIIFLSFFIGFFIMAAIMPVFNIMDSFS